MLAEAAGPRVPVSTRIALRDLARYRSRSGAALAAVSFAVFLAMLICVVASVTAANPVDWTGQNLSNTELIVYTTYNGPTAGPSAGLSSGQVAALHTRVDGLAASLRRPARSACSAPWSAWLAPRSPAWPGPAAA